MHAPHSRNMKKLTITLFLLVPHLVNAKPLNILLLYADDWRHDVLGVAGHPVVKTPHLDRLSSQGIRFTQNYVTTSICGISRASLYSGQWMARHGARKFVQWDTPWEPSYPVLLRENGYHTGHVGKWHNGPNPVGKFDFGRSISPTKNKPSSPAIIPNSSNHHETSIP